MTNLRRSLFQKVIVLFLLVACVLTTGCGISLLTPYTLPFATEDVACVTVTYGAWRDVVVIEASSDIEFLIDKMNQIELCPVYTITKKQSTADGIASSIFLFEMKDGTQYSFDATQINAEQTIFIDNAGNKYEVRNFHPNELYAQLYSKY